MDSTDGELQESWPELEDIARPARERRRLDPGVFSNLVIALCTRAPLSVRELSLLLERSEAYVGDAIRPLVADGRIQFLFPDQPKHPRQKYVAHAGAAPTTETVDDGDVVIAPDPAMRPRSTQPARTPEPARAPEPLRAPEPAHSASQHTRDVTQLPPAFTDPAFVEEPPTVTGWGSPAVSVVAAVIFGVLLGFIGGPRWFYYAIAGAIAFALLHVAAHSRQYAIYQTQATMRPSGPRSYDATVFLFAKAAFTFTEICVVVFAISMLRKLV